MINGESPPGRWKKNFRTSRDLFMSIVDELRPFLTPKHNSLNHRALIAEKKTHHDTLLSERHGFSQYDC